MMETKSILEIRRLNQFYGQSHTLWDVDLTVPEGSCVCLMALWFLTFAREIREV